MAARCIVVTGDLHDVLAGDRRQDGHAFVESTTVGGKRNDRLRKQFDVLDDVGSHRLTQAVRVVEHGHDRFVAIDGCA